MKPTSPFGPPKDQPDATAAERAKLTNLPVEIEGAEDDVDVQAYGNMHIDQKLDDPKWVAETMASIQKMEAAYDASDRFHRAKFEGWVRTSGDLSRMVVQEPGVTDRKLAWLEAELTKLDVGHFRIAGDDGLEEVWADHYNESGEFEAAMELMNSPTFQEPDDSPIFDGLRGSDYQGVFE